MRIDLFGLVEGVITGIIYFIYNVGSTIWTMLQHPTRGPLDLQRRSIRSSRPYDGALRLKHRLSSRRQRQIGALTFLFIIYFPFFGLFSNFAGEGWKPLRRALSTPPRLESEALWAPLVGAIVAVGFLDSVLRYFLRKGAPHREVRRMLLLGATEFALGFALLISLPVLALAVSLQTANENLGAAAGLAVPLFLASAYAPAAAYLLSSEPGQGKAPGWFRTAIPAMLLFFLTLFALLIGTFVLDGVEWLRTGL